MRKFRLFTAIMLSATLALSGLTIGDAGVTRFVCHAQESSEDEQETPDADTAGMYRSELTNEWIPVALQNQRPIAAMVDNEKVALPHYGVNKGDIVYEMMNSTANGRITRLMVIIKDWNNVPRLGNIRSTRPTNFILAAEYNAIVVHDGGPYYINAYKALPYNNNLSAGFARFSNGKRAEFTEYVTNTGYTNPNTGKSYAGLASRMQSAGISSTYTQYYTPGSHFNFSDTEITLDAEANVKNATEVDLPFPHNSSKLFYNATTRTYDYYEYGAAHVDAADNQVTTFKNAIIMDCSFAQLDAHGYLVYNILAAAQPGYYCTDGKAIPILWTKSSDLSKTVYYNAATLQPLTINTGKTYIAIVPSDAWGQLVIK